MVEIGELGEVKGRERAGVDMIKIYYIQVWNFQRLDKILKKKKVHIIFIELCSASSVTISYYSAIECLIFTNR